MFVGSLVRLHLVFGTHLKNALALHHFIDKGAFVVKIIYMVIFELIEECQLLELDLSPSFKVIIMNLHMSTYLAALREHILIV